MHVVLRRLVSQELQQALQRELEDMRHLETQRQEQREMLRQQLPLDFKIFQEDFQAGARQEDLQARLEDDRKRWDSQQREREQLKQEAHRKHEAVHREMQELERLEHSGRFC